MANDSQDIKHQWRVELDEAGTRLDVYLTQKIPGSSRTRMQSVIDGGHVTVNGKVRRPKDPVKDGDTVDVSGGAEILASAVHSASNLKPIKMDLDILFEDDALIVINKAAGIAVHPGAGTRQATLVQGLLAHCGKLSVSEQGEVPDVYVTRPGIVHRLDKDTSGVMVCAKTADAHRILAKQFQDKTNFREYITLLDGVMPRQEIDHESYLFRDPKSRIRFTGMSVPDYRRVTKEGSEPSGKMRYARSVFTRVAVYGERLTLARVRLFTGRTHQIRVHARELGLPVIGDPVYHRPAQLPSTFPPTLRTAVAGISRQMLHARALGFIHPVEGKKMLFEAPYPRDLQTIIELLKPYAQA